MEIKEEIRLELLNQDSVSVVFTKFIEYAGQKLQIGEAVRTGYVNSIGGREELNEQIKEPYKTAILAVWGDKPTVIIQTPENHGQNQNINMGEILK